MVNKLPNRWVLGLSGLALLTATAAASFYAMLFIALGTCWGDGGEPYSAPGSLAGRFCDGALYPAWLWAVLIPAGAVLVAAGIAVKRRAWLPLGLGALAALASVALFALPLTFPDG